MLFGTRQGRGAGFRRFLFLVLSQALLLPVLALAQQATPATAPAAADQTATILGTVKDVNGNVVPNAAVSLSNNTAKYSATASENGFFSLSVKPGTYTATVAAPGLVPWTTEITVAAGEYREIPGIVLKVEAVVSTIQVTTSEKELATQQVKLEEDQRLLGVVPNFYVSYLANAAPMSKGQKYSMAWKFSIDPVNFVIAGLAAGVEQGEDTYPGYGQGVQGYGKRLGAALADDFTSDMLGGAVFPALLHQDPRFYYRGTGSTASRIRYAIATVFICKGDNGKWQPNYSFLAGDFASGAISNLYYPQQQRGWQTTIDTSLVNVAWGAVDALAEEFVLKRFTHGGEARK
ncbi:MAG TPA: carboxypeptidase-like regulatory domain-containing protein [Acidobacteriaceae bacterium]|nr:carboxypeptidase-like regulatory domain-containing protein [Acidobacteriaceae bacterium]